MHRSISRLLSWASRLLTPAFITVLDMSTGDRQLFLSCKIVLEQDELDGGVLVDESGKIEAILSRRECEEYCIKNEGKVEVMERIINSQLLAYLEMNKLLNDKQYGFRKQQPTGDLLSYVMHLWADRLDRFGESLAVAMDISKAFDRVWPRGLLNKLPSYCIPSGLCVWFASFLMDRSIFVTNDGVVDAGAHALMAGVVDSHVHINEPGRTAWEGFRTATAAAAAAGATTLVDMPLNSIPPTTTLENLKIKANSAKDNVFVDVGFWGGVIPDNEGELRRMVQAGVVGFKCFLCPSGVEEFPNVTEEHLEKAFKTLEGTGSVLAFHAELEEGDKQCDKDADPEEYGTYLASRPPEMELNALNLIANFTEMYNVRVHIVHVSSACCVPILRRMRNTRLAAGGETAQLWHQGITAETCHHYLSLSAEQVPRGRSDFKCAPPVRCADNKELLWKSLGEGTLDLVVSDHSPCTSDLKCCNFLSAWGGISSLQFGLSLFWTEARKRGFSLHDVTRFLSASPAKLCGLDGQKGALKPGLDADFVIFNPNANFTVKKENIRHKNKLTPYIGMDLTGKVLKTYLRGKLIYQDEELIGEASGHLLLKTF